MSEGMVWAFTVPLMLFLILVAPIWLILHYRSKKKISEGLSVEDSARIRELADKAEILRDRVRTLEKLLDQENPNWRRNG
ncbi:MULTISPECIES: envelope stress response membrane protein PspB [Gammaproteobacteria]|uniref:envelope stress response membrane protein PspB n=1 Tax=Gammaproteobacteria TaxID=1236 RepID=UPI000DD029A8|nr:MULTISPECIES: envelope stress response membrane protein PspB [Gammaproteobacteria]RTE87139.1 envelope stress response membrane protein PspB [Aliidiomarina sp. B3213]TCZ93073.1 envelope stress response membrane protein PspB [Lysobacter sp. N42]